ncbi:SEC-C metal-binding domain-containing protein [Sporolituus thermophilus]|uniref:SEC-C metal-binding domain-containing protein n=1 Tax=Sporolituus thermophilus TaxID=608505 RepID=UPI000B830495
MRRNKKTRFKNNLNICKSRLTNLKPNSCRTQAQNSRNVPCPCGSGEKLKNVADGEDSYLFANDIFVKNLLQNDWLCWYNVYTIAMDNVILPRQKGI